MRKALYWLGFLGFPFGCFLVTTFAQYIVIDTPHYMGDFVWSDDSQQLAFVSSTLQESTLFIVDADGENLEAVVSVPSANLTVQGWVDGELHYDQSSTFAAEDAASPDGRWLAERDCTRFDTTNSDTGGKFLGRDGVCTRAILTIRAVEDNAAVKTLTRSDIATPETRRFQVLGWAGVVMIVISPILLFPLLVQRREWLFISIIVLGYLVAAGIYWLLSPVL